MAASEDGETATSSQQPPASPRVQIPNRITMIVDFESTASNAMQMMDSYYESLNLVGFQNLLRKRHAEIHQKSTINGGALEQYSEMTQDFLSVLNKVSSEVDVQLAKQYGNSRSSLPWPNWTGNRYFTQEKWHSGSSWE
ncbi:MAG: hypothetical protein Q9198_010269 [Flavoplaca austrocitrina]